MNHFKESKYHLTHFDYLKASIIEEKTCHCLVKELNLRNNIQFIIIHYIMTESIVLINFISSAEVILT